MKHLIAVLTMLLLALGTAHAWMKEGTTRGTIITTGEDRIVVQQDEGGQTTFEVANVKHGEEWVKDQEQLKLIKRYRQGDKVEVKWGQDHTGHSFIVSLAKLDLDGRPIPEVAREGKVRGTVIAVGEERLAVQRAEGGQLTLEPRWVQVQGKWRRDQDQIAFFRTLKQGEPIEAAWKLDEGTHFCVESIARLDAAGSPVRPEGRREGASPVEELHALRGEVAALRHDVAQLREMLAKLIEQRK